MVLCEIIRCIYLHYAKYLLFKVPMVACNDHTLSKAVVTACLRPLTIMFIGNCAHAFLLLIERLKHAFEINNRVFWYEFVL